MKRTTPSIWSIAFMLFILFLACNTAKCQTHYLLRDKYKGQCNPIQIMIEKKTGAIWYDSAIYCTALTINSVWNKPYTHYDIPYFYLRYRVLNGKRDPKSYKFYYPNRVTEFKMIYWWLRDIPTTIT